MKLTECGLNGFPLLQDICEYILDRRPAMNRSILQLQIPSKFLNDSPFIQRLQETGFVESFYHVADVCDHFAGSEILRLCWINTGSECFLQCLVREVRKTPFMKTSGKNIDERSSYVRTPIPGTCRYISFELNSEFQL